MKVKILGIDPGTINCGYAIIEKEARHLKLIEAGLIKIKTKVLQEQIVEMTEGIDLIFKNHDIHEVAIEDMFFAYNPKSVIKLAQFRGAISLKFYKTLETLQNTHPCKSNKLLQAMEKLLKSRWLLWLNDYWGLNKRLNHLILRMPLL